MTAVAGGPDSGRNCGTCTLCCKLMEVAALNKSPGVWCRHVQPGRGCGVYDDRPQSCRTFLCGYLTTPDLTDEWFPARSKLILVSKESGITALVDPSRPDAWRAAPYYEQIKAWARQMSPRGMTILVRVGSRCIVVLPDEDVDLGVVQQEDEIFVDVRPGPTGPAYRVSHERKGSA